MGRRICCGALDRGPGLDVVKGLGGAAKGAVGDVVV